MFKTCSQFGILPHFVWHFQMCCRFTFFVSFFSLFVAFIPNFSQALDVFFWGFAYEYILCSQYKTHLHFPCSLLHMELLKGITHNHFHINAFFFFFLDLYQWRIQFVSSSWRFFIGCNKHSLSSFYSWLVCFEWKGAWIMTTAFGVCCLYKCLK